jgi:PAS domain S-box-containing protein/putative nucleotidyltransferase with HDIG domain
MGKPLRVLIVEDSEDDALLIVRALRQGGHDPVYERVEEDVALRKALENESWDIILCGYRMPQFSGIAAIALLKETGIEIPLIIVSGAIGEETAVDCMRLGASDYVMKGNLHRLVPAIERELKEAAIRREVKLASKGLRKSEELFRSYLEYAPDGVYMSDLEGTFLYGNRKCEEIIGYRREELIGKNFLELNILPENSLNIAVQLLQANMEGKSTGPDEIELISNEGRLVPVEINTSVVQRMDQRIVLAFVRDITERKRVEAALRESESLSKSLVDYMHDAMIIMNWDGFILFANRAAARIIDFERPEELTGHNMVEYLHPDSFQKAAEDLEAVKADKMGFLSEYQLSSVTGKHIWVESIGGKIIFRNASANLVCIRDITERKRTEQKLQTTLDSLRKAFGTTIQVMVSAVESRDPYTAGHQVRSANLARAIATEMGLPHEKIEGIRVAGSIHDIGKLSIPAEILSKPTRLTELEFSLIKEHARQGYEMLRDVESPWPLAEIVYQHHERMDGSGYPRSLKGDEIIMEARILAVSDAVESMASHRPYRPAIGLNAALEEIEKNKGILYDADAVDACLRLFREEGFQL